MDDELRGILERHLAAPEGERPDKIVIYLKPESEMERRSRIAASYGLLDGDLLPLAAHIRAGFALDTVLAEQLADAIEGPDDEGFVLKMTGPKGHVKFSESDRIGRRNWDMVIAVWMRQKAASEAGERGVYASILIEVAQEFGVSESTLKAALAEARSAISE